MGRMGGLYYTQIGIHLDPVEAADFHSTCIQLKNMSCPLLCSKMRKLHVSQNSTFVLKLHFHIILCFFFFFCPFQNKDLSLFDLLGLENKMTQYEGQQLPKQKITRKMIQEIYSSPEPAPRPSRVKMKPSR